MDENKNYCTHIGDSRKTSIYMIPRHVRSPDARDVRSSMQCGECETPLDYTPETMTTVVQLCCDKCGVICFFCLRKKDMLTWKYVESEEFNYDFSSKTHVVDTRRYDSCSECWGRRFGDVSPDVMRRNFLCPEAEFGAILNPDPQDIRRKVAGLTVSARKLIDDRDALDDKERKVDEAFFQVQEEKDRLDDEWDHLERERRKLEEDFAAFRRGTPIFSYRSHKDNGASKKIKRERD